MRQLPLMIPCGESLRVRAVDREKVPTASTHRGHRCIEAVKQSLPVGCSTSQIHILCSYKITRSREDLDVPYQLDQVAAGTSFET